MSVVERKGMIGIVKGSGETETFHPRGNFSLKVVAKVDGENDGYLGRITRMPDNVTRDYLFTSLSSMHKNDFMSTINKDFGSGGMFCTLTDVDLGNYLLEKVTTFMSSPSYRVLMAVANVGQQKVNPPIYLLSQDVHLDEDGREIDEDQRGAFFQFSKIEPRLLPTLPSPYHQSLTGLVNLWKCVKIIAQHNSGSALLTFGAVAMNMHFLTVVELKGGAPIVVLYGEPDVGKTTFASAAMSILGIEACKFRGIRREYLVHLASQTSLGLFYDDPNKVAEVENAIIDFYNAITRGSFDRGLETPRCGFLLGCNFPLGKIQRLLSRVCIIPLLEPGIRARNEIQRQAFSLLKGLKEEASSSIAYFVALGKEYRQEGAFTVDEYEEKISPLLPNCGGRTVKGYANMLWFTIKVAELVGENSEDVWAHFESIAPTLDTLQQKCEGVGDKCINDAVKLTKYWEKVGTNLLELARKLKDHQLVWAYLQLGKQAGKESVALNVDVMSSMMKRYGMTPKFTAQDLKDNISQMECGVRAQSRTFHKLTDDFQWTGETANHKVPVMHLSVFPLEIQNDLATFINPSYTPSSTVSIPEEYEGKEQQPPSLPASPPLSPFDLHYPSTGEDDNQLTFACHSGGPVLQSLAPMDEVGKNNSESDIDLIPRARSTPKASPAQVGNKGKTQKRVRRLKLM